MESATQTEYHKSGKVRHKPTPSQEFLKGKFDYDHDLGSLVYKKSRKNARTWCDKGSKSHWATVINYQSYRHCRLVWAWHHGDPAEFQIDHIDGNRKNDRIENLRLATNSQNNANKKHYKGYRKTKYGRFLVDVMKDKKHYRGGTFTREEDAAKAAAALRKALHGEFADTRLIKPTDTLRAKTVIQMPLFD